MRVRKTLAAEQDLLAIWEHIAIVIVRSQLLKRTPIADGLGASRTPRTKMDPRVYVSHSARLISLLTCVASPFFASDTFSSSTAVAM